MAEEQGRSGGKSYGNRKSYGSGKPGGRGNRGFKPRRDGERGGHSYGRSRDGEHGDGGFHKGGYRKDRGEGYRKDGDFRRDREGGDGENRERRDFNRSFKRDGEHGGYRSDRNGYRGNGERRNGGNRGRDGENPRYRHHDGERSERRDFRRDGERSERRDFRRDGERRGGYRHDDDRRNDGERRDFHRDDRRDFHRDDRNGGNRRDFKRRDDHRDGDRRNYRHDGERRDFHRDGERRGGYRHDDDRRNNGERRDFHRDDRRNNRYDDRREHGHDTGERRQFSAEEKREYREDKRREYMSGPRRNSDGTMSFPSQNPYTDRRPGEPKMPKGMEWSMLSTDERERLRGLSKEHAENIGLHILAAYALEESDPENALEHAKWVARQASRIDFARETLALVAYRQEDYKLALREFRTAYRMNGFLDYLPFIADCERGTGNPKKAVELALSDEAKQLRGEAKVEMFLVYAGALADLDKLDKAVEIVHTIGRSKGLPGEYRMRAVQAEQYFLEEAGRMDDAAALDPLLDKLELQYADDDESVDDVVIDHDLERFSDDELDMLGISEDDAQYAPDDFDGADESADTDDSDEDSADEAGTESDDTEAMDGNAADAEPSDADESVDDESMLPAEEAQEGVDAVAEPVTGIDDSADETTDESIDDIEADSANADAETDPSDAASEEA